MAPWRTSTFRLVAMGCALFAAGVIAMLSLVYVGAARELNARTDATLRLLVARLLPATPETLPREVAAVLAENVSGATHLALFSAAGAPVVGDLREPPPSLEPDAPPRELIAPRFGPVRAVAVRTSWGETLVVARDARPLQQVRGVILRALVVGGGALALAGLATAMAVSLRPLRRLRELETTSLLIASGRLDLRMPVTRRRDELDLFAETVNAMVAEIERLLDEVKSATDAVAHDLRTPLTHVRLRLDRLARDPRTAGPVREEAEGALADLDEVMTRFSALMRISEVESRARTAAFSPVDLDGLVETAADLYEPLAESAGVALVVERGSGPAVAADGELLFEALANLVDNAIKFSPPGGTVRVRAGTGPDGPELRVEDGGPGIPVAERALVLQRFRRGATASLAPGAGLGLSLVAAVARLHRFELRLEDARPGLAAVLVCVARPSP